MRILAIWLLEPRCLADSWRGRVKGKTLVTHPNKESLMIAVTQTKRVSSTAGSDWARLANEWVNSSRGAEILSTLANKAASDAEALQVAQQIDPKVLQEPITR
jgi:hypothetical protein